MFDTGTSLKNCCSKCLQQLVQPVKLPCTHTMCRSCVQQLIDSSDPKIKQKCSSCATPIPSNFLNSSKPEPYNSSARNNANSKNTASGNGGECWQYEGRNGWWLYDENSNQLLENAHKNSSVSQRVSIQGENYIINFREMKQSKCADPSKQRKVRKASRTNGDVKGTAGKHKSQYSN